MNNRLKSYRPGTAALVLGGILAAAWPSLAAPAEPSQQAGPPPLSVQSVARNLYLVKGGSGANTAFYVTGKAVFVIDAKMSAESAERMLEEIGKITEAPVTTVILTHSDGDHINGFPGFPKGLEIVAHENCKADIEAAAESNSALQDYLPNKTYPGAELTLYKEDDGRIELLNFGPAHTNGDTIVWFPEEKTVFAGDLVFIGRDPLIHRHKKGNSFGYVKTLKSMLALSPAVDVFLSGHADPVTRADIEALAAAIEEKQTKVKAMIDAGRTLDEIKKAFGMVEPEGQGARRWPSLVETIYLELTGG